MSTIEVIALKPFIYSTDGYTEIPIGEKEVFHLPANLFDGLNDARYVRRATIGDGRVSLKPGREEVDAKINPIADTAMKLKDALETVAKTGKLPAETKGEKIVDGSSVDIPDDWKSLKWFALRSLASKVSSEPVKTHEDAVAAIEAELARRG